MKTNLKVASLGMVLVAVSASGVAYANCPAELSAEERISCIRIEGAGVLYQDYLAERAEIIADALAARAARADHDIAAKRQGEKTKEDMENGSSSSSLSR